MAMSTTRKVVLIIGGTIFAFILVAIIVFALIISSMGNKSVPENSVLVLNVSGSLPDYAPEDPMARIFGINFSGFLAWFLWRGIYWSKLPRLEKKVRVAIDWALDVFFSKDFVQYLDQPSQVISREKVEHESSTDAAQEDQRAAA